ncbi:hypothetical protein [Nocardioides convexus]|uniref:hypothetical protein n=1 Tax=Nocardioides convexus TaxID=2712224 RepID=UPI0024183ADC|nr:hypothetical protein [Nocardioides convexus]
MRLPHFSLDAWSPSRLPVAVPSSLRRVEEARRRFGSFTEAYLDAMWRGDPLADAFVADFPALGHGPAMRMLRQACREGIDAVADAPDSLRALFAALDDTPTWLDTAAIDHASRYTSRYSRASGIVLGAASLVSGYANSAASRPLESHRPVRRERRRPHARGRLLAARRQPARRPGALLRRLRG